jgi:hypothetical protein
MEVMMNCIDTTLVPPICPESLNSGRWRLLFCVLLRRLKHAVADAWELPRFATLARLEALRRRAAGGDGRATAGLGVERPVS